MKNPFPLALIPILFLSALLCIPVLAQTNFPPLPPAPVVVTNAPPDISSAIANLVHAIFPKFGIAEIAEAIGAIFLLARILRKALPNKLQTGKVGQAIRHMALEINPPKQEALKENPATNTPPPAPPVPDPPKA